MNPTIINYLAEREQLYKDLLDNYKTRDAIEAAALLIYETVERKNIVFSCGNGGSASQSAHFVGEMLNRFTLDRTYPLPAIDLTAHSATITAIANDYDFGDVFSKPITALGRAGDCLIGISTSGKSINVNKAVNVAGYAGMKTIYLLGSEVPKEIHCAPDIIIQIPAKETALVQEGHLTVLHMLCLLVDEHIGKKTPTAKSYIFVDSDPSINKDAFKGIWNGDALIYKE
jgi:phosphoheptose isomerase